MIQYNFPTVMFYGSDTIQDLAKVVKKGGELKRLMVITDPGLVETGLAEKVLHIFKDDGLEMFSL